MSVALAVITRKGIPQVEVLHASKLQDQGMVGRAILKCKPNSERSVAARKDKPFILKTYKFHALGDYVATIKRFGTTDSYSTEIVSTLKAVLILLLFFFAPPLSCFNFWVWYSREKRSIKFSKSTMHVVVVNPDFKLR
jgi:hypothetical protein